MKIAICDYDFPDIKPEQEVLSQLSNMQLVTGQCKSEDEVIALAHDADGIINQWNHITERVIDRLEHCKVIATYGIGYDKIDCAAAARRGICVCNVPDYCIQEVANHAMALMLALSRQLMESNRLMHEGKYGFMFLDQPLFRLQGKTVGLIGFGKIARALASKLQTAFEMKIKVFDPYVTDEQASRCGVVKVSLSQLLSNSDFVSIHVPLTEESRHMISDVQFALMKPTAYLINVGRGAIVDEDALYRALYERRIAGAGVDVFETEPLAMESPLMKLNNIILTPHSAYYTVESMRDLQYGAAKNVFAVLSGDTPINVVNMQQIKQAKEKALC